MINEEPKQAKITTAAPFEYAECPVWLILRRASSRAVAGTFDGQAR
jgi:hypothetical protein